MEDNARCWRIKVRINFLAQMASSCSKNPWDSYTSHSIKTRLCFLSFFKKDVNNQFHIYSMWPIQFPAPLIWHRLQLTCCKLKLKSGSDLCLEQNRTLRHQDWQTPQADQQMVLQSRQPQGLNSLELQDCVTDSSPEDVFSLVSYPIE